MKTEIKIVDNDNRELITLENANGHWKFNEDHFEDEKMMPLTINTISNSFYLGVPCKDEISHYDMDLYKETGELVETYKTTRLYHTLLDFIICRVNNAKEDFKKLGNVSDDWKHFEYKCVLFDRDNHDFKEPIETAIEYKATDSLKVIVDVIE